MFIAVLLSEITGNPLDNFTSLGAAGLMGAMWLWERSTSQKRESQIDEAHARIMGDRVQLDQLISVVRQNAEVLARLCATQEQLIDQLQPAASRFPGLATSVASSAERSKP